MAQLRRDYPKFAELDTEVIAVGPEPPAAFKKWWQDHKMPFIGIPDPDHAIAEGLYSQKSKLLRFGRLPSLAVIDKSGRLRLMHYSDSMSDIPTDETVLAMVQELNKEASSISS